MLNGFECRDIPIAAEIRILNLVDRRFFAHLFKDGMPAILRINIGLGDVPMMWCLVHFPRQRIAFS